MALTLTLKTMTEFLFPVNFLGKSAPCLQHLYFEAVNAISFREFPKLLSSARGLVSLRVEDIPPNYYYSGHQYILPMIETLARLTKLRTLCINSDFHGILRSRIKDTNMECTRNLERVQSSLLSPG